MSFLRWPSLRSSDSARSQNAPPQLIGTEIYSMEDLYTGDMGPPFPPGPDFDGPARETRRGRRSFVHRPRMVSSDGSGLNSGGGSLRLSVFGMHGGRLFSSFTSRRSAGHAAADSLSYESMLALDENNPKRGVKLAVLDKLQAGMAGRVDVDKDCYVCMERFKRCTKLLHLPCGHKFCDGCIRQWLHNHRTCPLCRFQFPDKDTHFVCNQP